MRNKTTQNITELAKSLGLSVTTVSRVLNGKAADYRISPKTEKRVKKAAEALNFIPNQVARGLKLDKTETIGLIIPDISNPYFAEIAKSIEAHAKKKGYSIILSDSGDNISNEQNIVRLLMSRMVDGIIIAPVGTQNKHLIKIHETGIPLVIIDRFFPESKLPYVTSDNYRGAYEAVQYLISNGHKRIACIQGIQSSQPNIERVNGYRDALKDNNIIFQKSWLLGNAFSKENGYRQAEKLFQLNTKPSAIFALSNLIALGVLGAAHDNELEIPNDISLISFDEQPYSAYLRTPMTTINQQKKAMGKQAVEYIIECINAEKPPKPVQTRLETALIIRNSVKNITLSA